MCVYRSNRSALIDDIIMTSGNRRPLPMCQNSSKAGLRINWRREVCSNSTEKLNYYAFMNEIFIPEVIQGWFLTWLSKISSFSETVGCTPWLLQRRFKIKISMKTTLVDTMHALWNSSTKTTGKERKELDFITPIWEMCRSCHHPWVDQPIRSCKCC